MHRITTHRVLSIFLCTSIPLLLSASSALAAPTVIRGADSRIATVDTDFSRPSELTQKAVERQLSSFAGFEGATVDRYAPIFGPDSDTVLYFEAILRKGSGDRQGWIIASATERDLPVVEFATEGPSHFDRFHRQLHRPFKMLRFGVGYIAAEGASGELLAEIGQRPALYTDVWREARAHTRGITRVEKGVRVIDERSGIPSLEAQQAGQLEFASAREHYEAIKAAFDTFLPPDDDYLARSWAKIRDYEPELGPALSYEYHWPSTVNHAYFVQMSGDEYPNENEWATGCGPTAWMNLYGYYDLNYAPKLLDWTQRFENDYSKELTLELRDSLHTYRSGSAGATNPWMMEKGFDFLANFDHKAPSYTSVWDMLDSDACYEMGREALIEDGQPVIFGYYLDWHYAIGLGLAEARDGGWQEEAWIYIYPAWTTNDSPFNSDESYNKWIPMHANIFGAWSLLELEAAPAHDTPAVGDFDGDGLDDIVAFSQESGKVRVGLSDGSSFSDSALWLDGFAPTGDIPLAGDFNGDGLDDVISFVQGQRGLAASTAESDSVLDAGEGAIDAAEGVAEGAVRVALSDGSSFLDSGIWAEDFSLAGQAPRVGDFNGDGLDDIATFTQWSHGNVFVALSDGSGFGPAELWHPAFAFDGSIPEVGDFNGDGLDDIIAFTHDAHGDVYVALSDGSSFGDGERWETDFGQSWQTPRVGDFNGDGLRDVLDFVQGEEADVYGAASSGETFVLDLKRQENFAPDGQIPLTGDFNGDGRDDLIAFAQDGSGDVWVAASSGVAFGAPMRWQGGR